ncbi:hypothetical protein [Streptomyces sp. NPDC101249]|uniref:hypothetical protein n=1 Tax=Streptomyces sp. NPDC101249 TaxID=3366140 RepID=UPI0037F593F7
MPYLLPSRTPRTPDQVERGFDYLLALKTGGGKYVSSRTLATPELAFLLLRLAENTVFPVTAVLGDGEPYTDSFALDEAGCIFLSALRDWTRGSPTTAVLWIARSIIRLVETVFPGPDDRGDTLTTLETMRDEHLEWARTVQAMTARP